MLHWPLPDSPLFQVHAPPEFFHVSPLEGREGLRWEETFHVDVVSVPQTSRSNADLPSPASLATSSDLTNRDALSLMFNFFVF